MRSLVIEEEENPVLPQRTSDVAAELVHVERLGSRRPVKRRAGVESEFRKSSNSEVWNLVDPETDARAICAPPALPNSAVEGWQEISAHRFVNEQGRDRPFLLGDADRLVDEADEEISGK